MDNEVLSDESKTTMIPFISQFTDAGRVQVRPDPEAHPQSEARHAAALRSQATQDAGTPEDRFLGEIIPN